MFSVRKRYPNAMSKSKSLGVFYDVNSICTYDSQALIVIQRIDRLVKQRQTENSGHLKGKFSYFLACSYT